MSSLTLVRHAQASFFAEHYDQLSPLGEKQARWLGEAWASRRWLPDEAYVGPRQRHQQTAAAVAAVYAAAGLPFPEPVTLADLDEYDLDGILRRLAPALAREDKDFADLLERQRHGATERDQARSFQRMFEPLLLHWQAGGAGLEGLESWPAFQTRVQRWLQQLTDRPGHGRRVVAFTSGGFIGAAVQLVLGAPDRMALELNWRIRNAALSEFVFSRERITLDTFNSIAHFAAPELATYR
jgi:broad specificity phosphatase PhoE